ncbi:hypothetical protein KLP28_03030 [Nocardioidaceae bacterium]|nr:hypothetical protein KLP28_03030 [Nocardioidaceae bacterium]
MSSREAAVRAVVRAITVIVPFLLLVAVGVGWWLKGAQPPSRVGALGVQVSGLRVVTVPDPDDESRLERAAARVAPGLRDGRFSQMDHRRAQYAVARVTVPKRAEVPEGSHLFLAVTQQGTADGEPGLLTSSWTWVQDGASAGTPGTTIGWSDELGEATDAVGWLSARSTQGTASPAAVELHPGDDLFVYAGLAEGARVAAEEVTVGLVWLGPGGGLWDSAPLA